MSRPILESVPVILRLQRTLRRRATGHMSGTVDLKVEEQQLTALNQRLGIGVYSPTWAVAPDHTPGWNEIREVALEAEAAGVDTVWVPDMFAWDFWEAWSVVAALAAVTSRIRIGTLILNASLRQPALVARMASTVDEISKGRLILGIGAGGADRAAEILGLSYENRFGRLEEAMRILVPLLREGVVDFVGEHFSARGATIGPRRQGSQGPPIWMAASGPRVTRLAATLADGVNFEFRPSLYLRAPEEVQDVNSRFDEACGQAGRAPKSVTRTGNVLVSFADDGADQSGLRSRALTGPPRRIAEQLHALHQAGIEHLWCAIDAPDDSGPMEPYPITSLRGIHLLTPVIEELRSLEG